jgi:hypothetical protein
MAETIETVCRNADQEATGRMKRFPASGYRGQLRYYDLSDGFLGLGTIHPALQSDLELHLGSIAKFPVIKRRDVWLTLAKLSQWNDNPFARPFRRGGDYLANRRFRGDQIPLIKSSHPPKGRLIAAVCYGFLKGVSHASPSYIEARFADDQWQCSEQYVNLYAQLKESRRVHTEIVDDSRDVPRISPEPVPDERATEERQPDVEREDEGTQ